MLATFYNPHCGRDKAITPFPAKAQAVVDALDGQTLALDEAAARLRSACPKGRVIVRRGRISLVLSGDSPSGRGAPTEHMWCAIWFRRAEGGTKKSEREVQPTKPTKHAARAGKRTSPKKSAAKKSAKPRKPGKVRDER
jgi:hypothetical protein